MNYVQSIVFLDKLIILINIKLCIIIDKISIKLKLITRAN